MAPTKASAAAAARPDPGDGKFLSARWVNRAMVALTVLFALRHPLVAPYTTGERSVPRDLSFAASSFANTTAALRVPAQRAQVLAGWREYVLGSDLGSASDPAVRAHFYAENEWKSSLFLWVLPKAVRDSLSHVVAIYVRNYIAIHLVYFGLGGVWAYLIYVVFADTYFPLDPDPSKPKGTRVGMPTRDAIRAQMWASVKAMHFYVLMPTMSEWFVERGLTRACTSVAEMGGIEGYIVWTLAYILFVEWAIYWIHRLLHEVRWAYKWLHHDHHIYNSVGDMSPFAGLAFHPLDGMLQASPYLVGLFLMPVHYWTHLALLFFTGVWTSLIHDTLRSGTEPVMGSKYHMYHHTAYRDK
jgi:Delta7-sterol 5-desaturase